MPKPNTRFLRNIIKNTDSHNKALLAKEAAESRARLGDLEHAAEVKKQKTNPDAKTMRKRQMGDIHAILGGKKRSERSEDSKASSGRRRDKEQSSSRSERRDYERSGRLKTDLFDGKDVEDKHRGRLSRHDAAGDRRKSDGRRRREENSDEESKHSRRRHRDRSRSKSPRHKSDSHDRTRSRRHRSPAQKRHSPSPRRSRPNKPSSVSDSDPLEDLIGPAPAPVYRGRGTVASSSGIDRRFSESYDPKADVDMHSVIAAETGAAAAGETPAAGGWDDAVEAFRDRQKLKQSQEERLRAAGFGDETIERMSGKAVGRGGKVEEGDVKWTKAGESREWDRGKDEKQPGGLFTEFDDEEM